jgi:hypothetical protein
MAQYPVQRAEAFRVGTGRFTFDSLGLDTPLFREPEPKSSVDAITQPWNVPSPVQRKELAELLKDLARPLPFEVVVSPEVSFELKAADLSQWEIPVGTGMPPPQLFVDPELGRLACSEGWQPANILVSYSYGFGADLGGGPYSRRTVSAAPAGILRRKVQRDRMQDPDWVPSLAAALEDWLAPGQAGEGVIEILDDGVYTLPDVDVNRSGSLVIQAADGRRPTLLGNLNLMGAPPGLFLSLNGVRLGGSVLLGGVVNVNLEDSTIWPPTTGQPALGPIDSGAEPSLTIMANRCILGPIRLPAIQSDLAAENCIMDGRGSAAVSGPNKDQDAAWGPRLTIKRCTVFGGVVVSQIGSAVETLFRDPVGVLDVTTGAARYSYIPDGSQTPKQYQCQPAASLAGIGQGPERDRVVERLLPPFLSFTYGNPGYARLRSFSPKEILYGAEDHLEMGVFHNDSWAFRDDLLLKYAEQWLPLGLQAFVFHVT